MERRFRKAQTQTPRTMTREPYRRLALEVLQRAFYDATRGSKRARKWIREYGVEVQFWCDVARVTEEKFKKAVDFWITN